MQTDDMKDVDGHSARRRQAQVPRHAVEQGAAGGVRPDSTATIKRLPSKGRGSMSAAGRPTFVAGSRRPCWRRRGGAEDTFKVAVGQLGLWAVDGPRLGQRAGIFKKHGIVLEIFGTAGGGETLQAVISGSADLDRRDRHRVGPAGLSRRVHPIRVIGANFTGAGDLYWYVRADSRIKRLEDAGDRTTIGYSASGSSSHNVVLAFPAGARHQRRCRPRPGRSLRR